MKIFIAGIANDPLYEDKIRVASELLSFLNMTIVSPKSGKEHEVENLKLLLSCDAVYFRKDWRNNKDGKEIYQLALNSKKSVFFETATSDSEQLFEKIRNAVYEATGINPATLAASGRHRKHFYAKLILTHIAIKNGIEAQEIAKYLDKRYDAISYYLKTYTKEKKYNFVFKRKAEQADRLFEVPL